MESTLQKEATLEQAVELGIRPDEFEMIKKIKKKKEKLNGGNHKMNQH